MNPRATVRETVLGMVRSQQLDTELYGSFCHDAFHLSPTLCMSYSDIDLFLRSPMRTGSLTELAQSISDALNQELGIRFRVSVRKKRIHDATLQPRQSYLISCFETLFKLANNTEPAHVSYQCARFILRTRCADQYFDSAFSLRNLISSGIKKQEATFLYEIKTGAINCTSPYEFRSNTRDILRHSPAIATHIATLQFSSRVITEAQRVISIANAVLIDRPELLKDMRRKLTVMSTLQPL